ncbi:hypothetical protein UA08_06735 [Talaromyces atroroseus]|uniref:Transmembrane protein n=1 Tax=Talaromyces atroroseus TaxID=1441469 RepID=A0A225AA71_TALAT|nr:hypothetical protein UA08_06735 [Talaromyces atroroseus]OKL57851.1 hypothetical protein UA08_06735 [Talaromyces atroroseus]
MFMRSFTFTSGVRACPSTSFLLSSRTFTFQAARFAQSSARQAVSKSKVKPTVKQAARKPAQSNTPTDLRFIGRRSESLAELDRKVTRQRKVVLFQASSQRAYILGAYGIGAFSFGYAIINSSIGVQSSGVQLATWQQSLYVGICIIMSVMGTVFISRTSRLIKNITAVNSNGQTLINVTVRSTIPFRKPYTITVAPQQIIFSRKITMGSHQIGAPGAQELKISFFRNPLQAMSFAFFKIFIAIRRIFTQEDFIMMEMQGQKGAFRVGIDGYVSQDLLAIGSVTGSAPTH